MSPYNVISYLSLFDDEAERSLSAAPGHLGQMISETRETATVTNFCLAVYVVHH